MQFKHSEVLMLQHLLGILLNAQLFVRVNTMRMYIDGICTRGKFVCRTYSIF